MALALGLSQAWNSKQAVFLWLEINWMMNQIIILKMVVSCCFTKHPLRNGCLGYQDDMMLFISPAKKSPVTYS